MCSAAKGRFREMNIRIVQMLRILGIPAHVKGYEYIKTAIMLMYDDDSYRYNITKRLYPKIAKIYETTPARVERAMRHAIEIAFTSGNIELLYKIFGYTIAYHRSKATNSQFIITILETLTLSDLRFS